MSGALTVAGPLLGIAQQALPQFPSAMSALLRMPRSIGAIIPDVTIEEHHSDRLQITIHPVATGTSVSDHAFKMPAQVTMRCGFSNSNIVGAAIQGFQSGGGFSDLGGGLAGAAGGLGAAFTENRAKQVYQSLLDLQARRQPFVLTTGKRTYPSMLIPELSVTTDHTSEYALMIEVALQEVNIVNVTTTTGTPQAAQAAPEDTSPTTDTGTKNPAAADDNETTLSKITSGGTNIWNGISNWMTQTFGGGTPPAGVTP